MQEANVEEQVKISDFYGSKKFWAVFVFFFNRTKIFFFSFSIQQGLWYQFTYFVRSVVFLHSVDYSYSAFLSVFIIGSLQSTRAISLINSPIIWGRWITYRSECKPSHQYLLVCHLEEDWLLFRSLYQSCCQKLKPEYTFQKPVQLKAKKSMST
jgi:hypothetical protein